MSTIYINEPATHGKVCLTTTVGDIDVELWSRECPLACRNFVQLCLEGYFNNTVFHRLVRDFIVQGGDPTGTGHGGESIYGAPFKDEVHSRLRFSRRGLVAMANGGKDDNVSQFFFTLAATPELQGKHTLFGKVVGNTVFNMIRLGEGDVDKSERPKTLHKIISTNVLVNPFPDIVPRELKKQKRKKEKEASKDMEKPAKNFALLSFGDEAEEDDEIVTRVSQKLSKKAKSAHDASDANPGLSAELAVRPEELGDAQSTSLENVDEEEAEKVRARIREKLRGGRKKDGDGTTEGQEEDLDRMLDEHQRATSQREVEELKAELKALQKDYKKALRAPRENERVVDETPKTEGMKVYTELKMKFKSKTTGIVKQKDPNRESQTMEMLEKFRKKLAKSNQDAILFDRKVEVEEEVKEKAQGGDEDEQGPPGLDLDAEDMRGDEWMMHRFVAPEEDPAVSRAKDANLRETSEEWYAIDDPRNPMNQRRRAAEAVAGTPSVAKKPRS